MEGKSNRVGHRDAETRPHKGKQLENTCMVDKSNADATGVCIRWAIAEREYRFARGPKAAEKKYNNSAATLAARQTDFRGHSNRNERDEPIFREEELWQRGQRNERGRRRETRSREMRNEEMKRNERNSRGARRRWKARDSRCAISLRATKS